MINMDKAIRYLSLAAKAGKIVIGAEDCEKIIKKGKAVCILLAADAAPSAAKRAHDLSSFRKIPIINIAYTKAELAQAVGRGTSVAVAILTDAGLASAFEKAAAIALEQEEHI